MTRRCELGTKEKEKKKAAEKRRTPKSVGKSIMSTEIYSPGLEGVIAGETAISTVTGGLRYRGYPVVELAEKRTFEDVAHLLLHGELPTPVPKPPVGRIDWIVRNWLGMVGRSRSMVRQVPV